MISGGVEISIARGVGEKVCGVHSSYRGFSYTWFVIPGFSCTTSAADRYSSHVGPIRKIRTAISFLSDQHDCFICQPHSEYSRSTLMTSSVHVLA